MTPTQFRALLWEQARRTGPAVALCALLGMLLPAFVELTATPEMKAYWQVGPDEISPLSQLIALFFNASAALILLIAYGTSSNLSFAVPNYALRLPVKTLPLLLTRFFYSLVMFLLVTLLIWSVVQIFDTEEEVFVAVVSIATIAFVIVLGLGWLSSAVPTSVISMAILIGTPLLFIIFLIWNVDDKDVLRIFAFGIAPAFALLGFVATTFNRRGDKLVDLETLQGIVAFRDRSESLHFNNPDEAQRWFERRQIGRHYLFLTFFFGILGTGIFFIDYARWLVKSSSWNLTPPDTEALSEQALYERIFLVGNAWAMSLTIAAVIVGGLWFIIVYRNQWGAGASFYFVRPMSTERLTRARVRAMLRILTTTAVIVLPIAAIGFTTYVSYIASNSDRFPVGEHYTDFIFVAIFAAATCVLLAWSALWVSNIVIMSVGILIATMMDDYFLGGDEDLAIQIVGFMLAVFFASLHWKTVGPKRAIRHFILAAITIPTAGFIMLIGANFDTPKQIHNLRLDHVDFLVGLGVGLFCLAPIVSTNYELQKARHR